MKKRVIVLSIILLIILCIAFFSMSLSNSNDTFYLIKLGQSITKNGIDMIDHFSWIPNLPYTYPHWLYSLILYLIYHNFGFMGIYISTLICFIILILVIYYINLKINKDRILALIVSIISIIPLSLFQAPRAQSVSIVFLILEVYFINQLISSGNKKYIVYLALCSLIIANVHATIWISFFVFFLPFFGEHLLYLFKKKTNKKLSFNNRLSVNKISNIKLVLITFIICFIVGLLSPSRICYTYFFRIALGDSQSFITEHAPIIIIKFPLIIILWCLLFFSKSKIKISEFLMLGGVTLMTFLAQRHLIFFCTIGLLYFSIILKRNIDEKNDLTFDILENKLFKKIIIPIILIAVLLIPCIIHITSIDKKFIDEKDYPVSVVKYIKENLDYQNIKIINQYNYGSYLLFNDIKVFIDSRCDLYYKEFNGQGIDILDDYFKSFTSRNKYDYDSLLNKYQAEYILINTSDPVYYMLKNDNRYSMEFVDNYFALYKVIKNI